MNTNQNDTVENKLYLTDILRRNNYKALNLACEVYRLEVENKRLSQAIEGKDVMIGLLQQEGIELAEELASYED